MCRCHRICNRRTTVEDRRGSLVNAIACQSKAYFCYCWHFWALIWIFEVKIIKKICLGVIRFKIGGLRRKLWARTWSNQLLKILLIKMFSNHSDFCFHITIPKILDKKSLYGRKIFISEEKKNVTKIFEKNQLFSNSLLRGDGGGTFRLHFPNL